MNYYGNNAHMPHNRTIPRILCRPSEFLDELEAWDPHYRTRYDSLAQAAEAAGLLSVYAAWLRETPEGMQRTRTLAHVADTLSLNRAERATIERLQARDCFERPAEVEAAMHATSEAAEIQDNYGPPTPEGEVTVIEGEESELLRLWGVLRDGTDGQTAQDEDGNGADLGDDPCVI